MRGKEHRQEACASAPASIPAVGALIWMAYGFIVISSDLAAGHTLQLGIYLEMGSVLAISAITIAEMIVGLRERKAQDEPVPAEGK